MAAAAAGLALATSCGDSDPATEESTSAAEASSSESSTATNDVSLDAFVGSWQGVVSKPGVDDYGVEMELALHGDDRIVGFTKYLDLVCTGDVKSARLVGAELRFIERTVAGVDSCPPKVLITLSLAGDRLRYSAGRADPATATLTRAD